MNSHNIAEIFSTAQRVKILEKVIYQTGHLSVSTVARELKLSKGLVSKYFSILSKQAILRECKNKFSISDSYQAKAAKLLFNLARLRPDIFSRYKFVIAAGIFGSCAKGENTEESDIDLWIKTKDAKEEELAVLSRQLKQRFRNLKVLFLTADKIKNMREKDPLFYYSLSFGSISLYGEKDAF